MSVPLDFWKLQSVGNDFPLFHEEDLSEGFGAKLEKTLPRLAVAATDRRFGIGGDGILTVGRDSTGLRARMFNPDGTEDFCGNGLRCVAVHAHRLGWVSDSFTIRHRGQIVRCWIESGLVGMALDPASYSPPDVPLAPGADEIFDREIAALGGIHIRCSSLTTGSTHTIVPVAILPSDEDFARLGPAIENASVFPQRTSVIFSRVLAPGELSIRIWERGVGETLGCGTGASAAATDYLRRAGGSGPVAVSSSGGRLIVKMGRWDESITVIGEAHEVYSGQYSFEPPTAE